MSNDAIQAIRANKGLSLVAQMSTMTIHHLDKFTFLPFVCQVKQESTEIRYALLPEGNQSILSLQLTTTALVNGYQLLLPMMVTPTHLLTDIFFYAVGNTPAVNLTSSVPPDQDADILLLGCGDVRNILFSIYIGMGNGMFCILGFEARFLIRIRRSQD